jgi:hypothetical protein
MVTMGNGQATKISISLKNYRGIYFKERLRGEQMSGSVG